MLIGKSVVRFRLKYHSLLGAKFVFMILIEIILFKLYSKKLVVLKPAK